MLAHSDPDYLAIVIQSRIKAAKKEVEQNAI